MANNYENLSNNKYFEELTEKVLGDYIPVSSKYGTKKRVKGDLETALSRMLYDAPFYNISDYGTSSQTSQEIKPILEGDFIIYEDKVNIVNALQVADKEIEELKQQRDISEIEMLSFEDIDRIYNKNISLNHKRIFVYHQVVNLNRTMKGGWEKYDITKFSEKEYAKALKDIVLSGDGIYDGEKYVPDYIYLSGNVYNSKKTTINNYSSIVESYGQDVLDKQLKRIEDKIKTLDNSRLTLDNPDFTKRLVIKIFDKITTTFQITRLVGVTGRIRVSVRTGKEEGKLNVFGKRKQEEIKSFSLQDGFFIWYNKIGIKPEIKYGLSIQDIYQLVINQRKRSKDEEVEVYQRLKRDANKEAKRLFAIFLADGLYEADRLRLEQMFAEDFDSDLPIDFNNVPIPIGFSCSKKYGLRDIEIRPKQVSAIRAIQIKGSMCLAYGVGLGKTLASIFSISQMLENGWCERPMFVVPNQVYSQFSRDLYSVLPQYQLNKLKNLNKKFQTILGQDDSYYSIWDTANQVDKKLLKEFNKETGRIPEEFLKYDDANKNVIGIYGISSEVDTSKGDLKMEHSPIPQTFYFRYKNVEFNDITVAFPFVINTDKGYFVAKPDKSKEIDISSIGNAYEVITKARPMEYNHLLGSSEIEIVTGTLENVHDDSWNRVLKMPLLSINTNKINHNHVSRIVYERKLPSKSITIVTYQAVSNNLGLKKDNVDNDLLYRMYMVLNSIDINQYATSSFTESQIAKAIENAERELAKITSNVTISMDKLGIDFMVVDEAHSAKKVISKVGGEVEEITDEGKVKSTKKYYDEAAMTSAFAVKIFGLSQYIQYNNKETGNILLLTATPFTNAPSEIYSMCALLNYDYLAGLDLGTAFKFFNRYVKTESKIVVSPALEVSIKNVITGFENLSSMQKIIRRLFLYEKEAENIQRPNLITIPKKFEQVEGVDIKLKEQYEIPSFLSPTLLQQEQILHVRKHIEVNGFHIGFYTIFADAVTGNEMVKWHPLSRIKDAEFKDVKKVEDGNDKRGRKLIKATNLLRQIAFSPYMFSCKDNDGLNKMPDFNAQNFVETSAKIAYVVDCIRCIKEYCEGNNMPVGGVIIYTNFGVEYLKYIKEYLVDFVGYKDHEVNMIYGSQNVEMTANHNKADVQELFLGRKYNEVTEQYEPIPDEYRTKVLLGTKSITEGINLQKHCVAIFNLTPDWNPTDNIQLIGRGWRDGNNYKNMRMVFPLLEDSVDIFIFQKQEEKTKRINAIWDYDSHNSALDLDDFNPEDLKYELITNPKTIVQMKILDRKEQLKEELGSYDLRVNNLRNTANNLKKLTAGVERAITHLVNVISKYKIYELFNFGTRVSDNENEKIARNFILYLADRKDIDITGLPIDDIIKEIFKPFFKYHESSVVKLDTIRFYEDADMIGYLEIAKKIISFRNSIITDAKKYSQKLQDESKDDKGKITLQTNTRQLDYHFGTISTMTNLADDLDIVKKDVKKYLSPFNIKDSVPAIVVELQRLAESNKELREENEKYTNDAKLKLLTEDLYDEVIYEQQLRKSEDVSLDKRIEQFCQTNYLMDEKVGKFEFEFEFTDNNESNRQPMYKVGEKQYVRYNDANKAAEVAGIHYRKDKSPLYRVIIKDKATDKETKQQIIFNRIRFIAEEEFRKSIQKAEQDAKKEAKRIAKEEEKLKLKEVKITKQKRRGRKKKEVVEQPVEVVATEKPVMPVKEKPQLTKEQKKKFAKAKAMEQKIRLIALEKGYTI